MDKLLLWHMFPSYRCVDGSEDFDLFLDQMFSLVI